MSIRPLSHKQANQPDHPLGRFWIRSRDKERNSVRRRAALLAIACGGLLGLALWMQPSPKGYGTHTQLGIPACPTAQTFPCPTCGMTTAFSHTVRGQLIAAIAAQPMGWLLAVATIALFGFSSYSVVTGVTWRLNWYRVSLPRVTIVLIALMLASWGYKILAVTGAGLHP